MNEYLPEKDVSAYKYLLLGDISGIQEFIFNVKSEGAAKTLKSKSFFVYALAELCLKILDEAMPENCLLFYNGGGNFYVFCKKIEDTTIAEVQRIIQEGLSNLEIYLTISYTPLLNNFSNAWKNLHQSANKEKLNKYNHYFAAFNEEKREESAYWKEFAKRLTRSKGYQIDNHPMRHKVNADGVSLFGKTLEIGNKTSNLSNSILNKLPEWTTELLNLHAEYVEQMHLRSLKKDSNAEKPGKGSILEFETMGYFASLRTGTDKIAILKMDVDNLGKLFLKTISPSKAKQVSDALKSFFEEKLLELWNGTFDSFVNNAKIPVPFKENIYIVFAGGDDCMIIGGWDAVFEFAKLVRENFILFSKSKGYPDLTVSASLNVLDSKFPVVRMSALAEEAIKEAKNEEPQEKNRISVFGKVLTWDDFTKAYITTRSLENLIKNKNEPRGILNRLQVSHIGYEKLQEKAIAMGSVSNPAVWRLFYFIRNSKNVTDIQDIVEVYQRALLDAIINKKRFNAAAMTPVSARWAEMLTRKKTHNNEG